MAMGRFRAQLQKQDLILVHGLLEYMPDRIVLSLLTVARGLLNPGGAVIATGLSASPDHHLLDRLLGWPTIRRRPESVYRMLDSADLDLLEVPPLDPPAMLVCGTARAETAGG